MKITRRDLGVIMILAGILIAFLAYKMSFEKTMEEIETLQTEQENLQKQIKELEPLEKESVKWEKAKKEIKEALDKMVGEFSVDIWQENNIMTVVDIMDALNNKKQGGQGIPVTVQPVDEDDSTNPLDKYNIIVGSFSAEPATVIDTVEGEGSLANRKYILGRAFITMSYQVKNYQTLKDYIDYIYTDKYEGRRLIDNITMTFDKEKGSISGNTTVFDYVLTDGKGKYEPVELPDDNIGIENENDNAIFGETETPEEESNGEVVY